MYIPLKFPVPPTYLVLLTHFVNDPLIFICLVTQKYRVEELKVVITRLVSFMIERVIFFMQEFFSKSNGEIESVMHHISTPGLSGF